MNSISYWEKTTLYKPYDYCIIGAGIVGLSTALELQNENPKSRILVLDKYGYPHGASYKNAGFACFGSSSELLSDLTNMNEDDVFKLVELRVKGLNRLRKRLGDKRIDYNQYGSYELFNSKELFMENIDKLNYLNKKLRPIFNTDTYEAYTAPLFGFSKDISLIKNIHEGQINSGLMMESLLNECYSKGINVLKGLEVKELSKNSNLSWNIETQNPSFTSTKVFLCNNAFVGKLIPHIDIKPARAQALITKPIENLKVKGCFHMNKGFYYFRNINNRILIGGGRNLDLKQEETFEHGNTSIIIEKLTLLLEEIIIPDKSVEIDYAWSGTMGISDSKFPIVKKIDTNLYCAVRMGGMGIALGSEVAHQLLKLQKTD